MTTRARILDGAARLFRTKGYARTRLADVAAEVGIQPGSLRHHFRTRDDLVEELLRVAEERTSGLLRRSLAKVPPSANSRDRLRGAVFAHLDTILDFGDYAGASMRILAEGTENLRKGRLQGQREYLRMWRELIREGQQSGDFRDDLDPGVARMVIIGAMNSASEWSSERQELTSAAAITDLVTELFVNGLAVRHPSGLRTLDVPLSVVRRIEQETQLSAQGRERILEAAATIFTRDGYGGTRLADIARMTGTGAATLYNYFDNREDLVVQLLRSGIELADRRAAESLALLGGSATPEDRLETAMVAHLFAVLESNSRTSSAVRLFRQAPNSTDTRLQIARDRYRTRMSSIVDESAAEGCIRRDLDLSAIILLMTGCVNHSAEWFGPGGRMSLETIVRQISTLTLDGLVRRAPEA